jgi:hypothetical protein
MATDSNILDLEIKQGQDEELLITVKNEDGSLVDLTGFTFAGQVRDTFIGSLIFSFSFQVQNQGTNQGEVKMTVAASVTSRVKINQPTSYVYDVEMNSGSKKTRILEGKLGLSPEVTR